MVADAKTHPERDSGLNCTEHMVALSAVFKLRLILICTDRKHSDVHQVLSQCLLRK